MHRHPRLSPAVYQVSITGPFDAKGPGDTPSRRRIFVAQPKSPDEEEACAKQILSTLMRRAYRRPVADADLERIAAVLSRGASGGGLRRGHRGGPERHPGQPRVSVPRRTGPGRRRAADGVSHQRPRTGVAAVVLPLEQHPRRRAARRRRARRTAQARRCSSKQARRMLADPRSQSLVTNFAGAVAAPAQPRLDHARPAAVPRLRRQPAPGVPPRDRAALRGSAARGPQRARPAEGGLHVPERAAREALRHPATSTAPASAASRSTRTASAAGCCGTAAS